MPSFRSLLIALCIGTTAAAHAQAPSDPAPIQPYVLAGTEVRSLHASRLNRDYPLFISLPASYKTAPQRNYPVLFVTDADYAFPLVRSIGRRVGNGGKDLEEFILVGLGYATGDTPIYSRQRDYTPSPQGEKQPTSDMPGRPPVFGEAEGYRQFIASEVIPFIAKNYRIDMSRKVFAGHSYGALLGMQALFTEPGMFDAYILGSPSIWYDHKLMFTRERAYAASHKDLKARVYMAIGGFETVKPGAKNPRYNRDSDMVRDMQEMERVLKSRRYPGLSIRSEVVADEDHLTVAPAILTRGLTWAFGKPDSHWSH